MSAEQTARFTALNDDIQAFRHYIQAERGLAVNTHLAYSRDLDRFLHWAAGDGFGDYLAPTLRELTNYIEFLRNEGLAPASLARHLVSLKMFYRFLRLEERTSTGTVDLLSSPSLWAAFPRCSVRRRSHVCWKRLCRTIASICATGPCWRLSTPPEPGPRRWSASN